MGTHIKPHSIKITDYGTIKDEAMILAEDQYYSLDCYKTRLNNNILVVGTSGSGKTRSIVSPNILQAQGSYVISDPKGNLHDRYKDYLENKGYRVVRLDFISPERSVGYNAFDYIHSEVDIIKIAHMMMSSMKDLTGKTLDPFWDDAAELLLQACIGYLHFFVEDESRKNINCMFNMVKACNISDDLGVDKNMLDKLFEAIPPTSFPSRQYAKFRQAAGRTLRSILITLNAKLGSFDTEELKPILAKDEIYIATIGQKKTALFVVVSDTDRSMDGLANMFFTQAMNELCLYADKECADCRLPVDVRFILDDFATNCRIADFPKMIASIRSRGISTMLMIQAESQLEAAYNADGRTIIANCDTYVYMGGNDVMTAKNVASRCNCSLEDILYMPVETNWIFRRGQKPVNGHNFDLDSFELYKMACETEKER